MSDIEKICERNHERRRWAEEYETKQTTATPVELVRNEKKKQQRRKELRISVMRNGSMACLMASGAGAAFVGIGASMGDWQTVLVGTAVTAVFILTGTQLEWLRGEIEGGRRDA